MATKVKASADFKSASEQANQAGNEFVNLYYETFDKRRHVLSKLYTDASTLVWNGNAIQGGSKLQDFFASLPTSESVVQSFDCQPVSDLTIPGQTTIMVVVEGIVKFDGNKAELFSQNFMLTSVQNVWKIASDCLRFVD